MSKKNKKLKKLNKTSGPDITTETQPKDAEYIKDTSPYVYQKSKLKSPLHIRVRNDLTEKQKQFLALAMDKNVKIIFISGPAGTSKTHLAILSALQLLNDKKISDILYLRSVVESAAHSLGYLKGDLEAKVSVYLHPLMDKLEELLQKQEIDMLMNDQRITGQSLNFIRGSHYSVRGVIFDEAQNANFSELYTLITRMGEHSRLFILGDSEQSDIKNSGFEKMISMLDDEESRNQGIHVFRFGIDDVVRSGLVKFLLKKLKKS